MNSLEEMGFTNDSIKNTQQQKVLKNMKIMNNKNSQHLKLKTLLTRLASSSTSNQHMTKLSMLKFNYNLVKKCSLARQLKELLEQMVKSHEPMTTIHLNSIIYDVEFPDGQVKEYAAKIIA